MIYEVLPEGEVYGITGRELMSMFGISTTRELRRVIRDERMRGKPIINSGSVYFRSSDPEDYKKWYRITMSKGKSTLQVAKAVMECCPENDGQITLDELLNEDK